MSLEDFVRVVSPNASERAVRMDAESLARFTEHVQRAVDFVQAVAPGAPDDVLEEASMALVDLPPPALERLLGLLAYRDRTA